MADLIVGKCEDGTLIEAAYPEPVYRFEVDGYVFTVITSHPLALANLTRCHSGVKIHVLRA